MTASSSNYKDEIPSSDAHFVFECVRHLDTNGFVDLGHVAETLGYTNVASVGNRFRALRKRYDLNLECKNTGKPSKAKSASGASSDAVENTNGNGAGTPRKGRSRKVLPKPIPATGATVSTAAGGSEAIAARKLSCNPKKTATTSNARSKLGSKGSQSKGPISPALLQAVDYAVQGDGDEDDSDESDEKNVDAEADVENNNGDEDMDDEILKF